MAVIHWRQTLASLVLALVGCLMLATAARAACALTIGWEPYVPYQFFDATGEVTGADIELARQIGDAVGCELTFSKLPWARQLSELRNGSLDVAMSASWTEERNEYVRFSIPYRQSEMAIFVRRGTVADYPLTGLVDIPKVDFRLGVVIGYYYGEAFEELRKQAAFAAFIDPASDYPTNIRKLLHDRIDGFLSDDLAVMRAEARALDALDMIERYPLQLPGDDFHIMFSRRSVGPEIVAEFDEELEVMKTDGRLAAILQLFID